MLERDIAVVRGIKFTVIGRLWLRCRLLVYRIVVVEALFKQNGTISPNLKLELDKLGWKHVNTLEWLVYIHKYKAYNPRK